MSRITQFIRARGHWLFLIAAFISAAMVLYAWRLPPFHTGIESTENAYVRGQVTVVAPKVDGYVAEVLVQDYDAVKAGQVLVRLDCRNYQQKLEQARGQLAVQQANLANAAQTQRAKEAVTGSAQAQIAAAEAEVGNAQAQLARARADMRRAEPLAADGSLSQRERDQTEAALRQAEATLKRAQAAREQARAGKVVANEDLQSAHVNQDALKAAVQSAEAAVELAQIDLDNTEIRAPRDGHLGEVGVKLGQYVAPGTQLLAVVPSQVWVVANFKETQTSHMQPGQPVRFEVDALDNTALTGQVEQLSPATGSEFSVIKPDNATGNFIKIPQRLSVRIAVDPNQETAQRLRPGMSVVVHVDTNQHGHIETSHPAQEG
ncbi:HlyD family secretion protein [Lampropedia puyangensis]|uniref:HlyD family secretion protein n=1 Tax=Lampropedia puyangensis TaxID=1330072 RepID=A0A4S8EUS6_9BURK|nr:HlyD family secretion protein [Lampropedia puyangensis]THT98482.1 HlyD family secretion protein [Lampropedia puyangensis]